jgi:hypothetical protein
MMEFGVGVEADGKAKNVKSVEQPADSGVKLSNHFCLYLVNVIGWL